MRKVIDLCLDMPMGAEALTNMLGAMCLDPLYRGYKKTYGAGVAAQVGLTVEEIDAIYESEGRDGFLRIIREAAEKHAVKPAEFVRHLDEVGVEWGITCDGDHDNRKTAEIVQAFPKKFKGFIYVDPNRGEEAVRELEVCVKEYGLHALYLTAFRTKLNAADRKNYPLYSKACELGIPVHIYSSLNLSKAVPYDIGHPRYIDQVARDFPELKIMAGVSGWPWVLDVLCLAIRHENVYLNFETHAPEKIAMRGSGYEPYLYYGETSLKERICFASNWGTQSMPVEQLIAQVEALPFSDDAKEHILYNNAKTFYELAAHGSCTSKGADAAVKQNDEVAVISSLKIIRKRHQFIAIDETRHDKRKDDAGKAACNRIPCAGNTQLYRVLRRTNHDAGANAGAYCRCNNKPDSRLPRRCKKFFCCAGVLAPAQCGETGYLRNAG